MTEWSGMQRGSLDLTQKVDQPQTLVNPRLWRGGELSRRLGMARSNIARQGGPILGISGFSPRPGYPSGGLFQGGNWEGFTESGALWGGGASDASNYTIAIYDGANYWDFYAIFDGVLQEFFSASTSGAQYATPVFVNNHWYTWNGNTREIIKIALSGTSEVICETTAFECYGICVGPNDEVSVVSTGMSVLRKTGFSTWETTFTAMYVATYLPRGRYCHASGSRMSFVDTNGITISRLLSCSYDGNVSIVSVVEFPDFILDMLPGSGVTYSGGPGGFPNPITCTSIAGTSSILYTDPVANGSVLYGEQFINGSVVSLFEDHTAGVGDVFRTSDGNFLMDGTAMMPYVCGPSSHTYLLAAPVSQPDTVYLTQGSNAIADLTAMYGYTSIPAELPVVVAEI